MPNKGAKSSTVKKCTKCFESMEEGIVVDRGPYNFPLQPHWMKGSVEFSWKTGVKTMSGRVRDVATWRCTTCGYLESYTK